MVNITSRLWQGYATILETHQFGIPDCLLVERADGFRTAVSCGQYRVIGEIAA